MTNFKFLICLSSILCFLGTPAAVIARGQNPGLPYRIVDTAQDRCFSDSREISFPKKGESYYGQDAQYQGAAPAYRDNGDGTVTDLNTGLMWVKSPDQQNKKTHEQAVAGASLCRVGGYTDWRLPTIKELYSLILFNGYTNRTAESSRPYLETGYFGFAYGDTRRGERMIDAQYASSTLYVGSAGTRLGGKLFGVNFADGRIKGYDLKIMGRPKTFVVRYVRGNPAYGRNDFIDNKNGTISDRATGLMWMKADNGRGMNWRAALAYAEGLRLAGYDDWRLPNAKELQSLVDYSRAPDAVDPSRRGPAMDPIFHLSRTESWFWTGTTHLENGTCRQAVYVAFGQAPGKMHGTWINVHGAGAQRSDPKSGDPAEFKNGRGPQGDEIRINNHVLCVRGGARLVTTGPPINGSFSGGERPPRPRSFDRPGPPTGGFVGRLDRNGDGKVSRSEFDGPPDQFPLLDRNGDGYLSEDEAPQFPPRGGSSQGRPGKRYRP